MRYPFVAAAALFLASVHTQVSFSAVGQALPVKEGRPVVAAVDGVPISLDELVRDLGTSADSTRLRQGHGSKEAFDLLGRLVNVKLVVKEAATMGLDRIPEIRKEVDVSSRVILREVLMERLVKDVKPDPVAVEKVFKELSREWKTSALLFQAEAAAKSARDQIAKGATFADVAAKAVAAKTAKADGDNAYHGRKDYLPPIAEAVARLRVGQVSPVVRIQAGFVIVTVTAIRYPEDAEAREEARKRVVAERREAVLQAHEQDMRRKLVVIRKAVLDGLDYGAAKPGIDALLKDTRVVADIKGGAPVTVGDLTDYLRMQYFHGGDPVGQGKKMNTQKEAALNASVGRRLMNMEALRLGIDKTHAYRDRVRAYEEGLVFDAFVKKVIVPDNKMREEEVRRHYDGHLKEYSYPEMRRMRSLAFTARGAAEEAMRKLRGGADFGWLVATAEGQVDRETRVLRVADGQPVTTASMPEGMQKALAGSRAGDYRLYASPEGHFYVLAVQEVITPSARPYDEVREEIAKKLYSEKLNKSMEGYLGKLRALSKVEIYLKRQ